jgi:trypsin
MLLNVIFTICCAISSQIQCVAGILKGHDINIEQRPYQAFIIHNSMNCGGAILNRRFIITAAHCVEQPDWGFIWVGLNLRKQGELHYLREQYIHPLYVNHGRNWTQYDVALIELESELDYSEKVQPIKLPEPNQLFREGLLCDVSGWGLTEVNSTEWQDQLQTVRAKIVQREDCATAYEDFAVVDESMICGGSERDGELAGPCMVSGGGN